MPEEKFSPAKTGKWTPGAAAIAITKDEEIACRLCEKQTKMLGTKLCDRCWELETRIHSNPKLAAQILGKLSEKEELNESRLRSLMQKLCPVPFRFSKRSQDNA